MLIKLGIIFAILIGGGILFTNEINQFLPATSANLFDSVKNDFGKIKNDTIQSAETNVKGTIVTVNKEVNEFKENPQEILSKNIKDVTESTTKSIKGITETTQKNVQQVTESTQTIFNSDKNNQIQNSTIVEDKNSITNLDNDIVITNSNSKNTIPFETLSLKTTQQSDNSVMLQYEDTSGKTISVSITLRTTEREIFSGVFYSSMFETFVNDISNVPYFIDVVVEHEEYGTVSSSVYNPTNSQNTIINGIFSKS